MFSGVFKDIAKEFDVPFVALAQINRGVEGQANKRPFMSDIKDTGDKGIMQIQVGKNRNGATGMCKVMFDLSVGSFYSSGN